MGGLRVIRGGVAVVAAVLLVAGPAPGTALGPVERIHRTSEVISGELFGRRTGVVVTRVCFKKEGNKGDGRCREHIFLTRDLGRTWRDVSPPQSRDERPFFDVYWMHKRFGWAVVGFCDEARLVSTTDGGRTWSRAPGTQYTGCHAGADATIDFVNRRNGFMGSFDPVAEGSWIARTHNSGRRWSEGNEMDDAVGPIEFHDRRHGYLAATFFGHSLHYSHDGGRSWRQRHVRRPPGYGRASRLYDLPTFVGTRRVLPITLEREGREDIAFYSAPIGHRGFGTPSVLRLGLHADRSYFRSPLATSVASASRWWAFFGRGAHVALTRDAGRTWLRREPEVRGGAHTITAVGGRAAWITTEEEDSGRKRLYVTRDGGRTWRRLRPGR